MKGKKQRNPFKGFSEEELRFFRQHGRDVKNYRMPAMPRPVVFDDRTKFKRSRKKAETQKLIKEETL